MIQLYPPRKSSRRGPKKSLPRDDRHRPRPWPSHPMNNAEMPRGMHLSWALVLVFALTQLIAAGLLFLVQPMIGKLLLPFLGGTPAVWNTCMVFFQALLLAGYLYAHFLSRRLPLKKQALVHSVLLVA